jgi:hypothetical protein
MKTNFSLTLLFIFAILIIADSAQTQSDDNGAPYFPLRTGNSFYFKRYISNPGKTDSAFVISRIIGTKVFKGNRYYYVSNIFGRTNSNFYVRYNNKKGYLVYLDTNNAGCDYEIALYNLAANIGDSVSSSCRSTQYKCYSISDSAIFDIVTRVKNFSYYNTTIGFVTRRNTNFARRLGCIFDGEATFHGNGYYTAFSRYLQGCKVNNVIYGDTIDHITPMYSDSGKYMPLAIGNKWVYATEGCCPPNSSKLAVKVVKDSVINGKKYFYLDGLFGDNHWVRYDGANGYLMIYNNDPYCNYEAILFNFAALKGDSAKNIPCSYNERDICYGNQDTVLLGLQTITKDYNSSWTNGHYYSFQNHYFAKRLGMYYYSTGYGGNASGYGTWNLLGCYINGILYGDTTTVTPTSYADSARYFPIAIGNRWVFDVWYYPAAAWSRGSFKITRDTIINNRRYFYLNGFPLSTMHSSYCWISYDTSTGVLKLKPEAFGSSDDYIKLSSHTGDTLNYICSRIADTSVFNYQSKRKLFEYHYYASHENGMRELDLIKNIGPVYYINTHGTLSGYEEVKCLLRGCVINGVLYGDTSTVGINSISNNIPDKYALYQNYPNPFNPTTIIRFQIKDLRLVTIKAYDILGKEVVTLVNDKLKAGEYEVTFDGSMLPSGVYFYKLQAGDFTETKKMLMIK